MRVGLGGRCAAKRITLRQTPSFGIAAFLFLYFGNQQTEAPLGWSLIFRDLDLVSSFAG